MKTITLRRNNATRTIPTGFSWTTLFFGFIPSAIRFHWIMAGQILACDFIGIVIGQEVFKLDYAIVPWLGLRIACAAIRNERLFCALKNDGWLHLCVDNIFEIKSKPDNDEVYYE